jgi:hypothetical protein
MDQSRIYHNYHLRSLFISKFLIREPKRSLGNQTFNVSLSAPADDYNIVNIFLFLLTSRWPQLRLTEKKDIPYFSVTSKVTANSPVFVRLREVYLVREKGSKTNELGYRWHAQSQTAELNLVAALSALSELDFLTQHTYTYLQAYSTYWKFRLVTQSKSSNSYLTQCWLRSLCWPSTK